MNSTTRLSAQTERDTLSLYSPSGARKYLKASERERFLLAAERCAPDIKAFCFMLAYTGCRLSEALGLTFDAVQVDCNIIAIRTLKKRRAGVIREVPVPDVLVVAIQVLRESSPDPTVRVWAWGRTWAWTLVKQVMAAAGISGEHASPKGLRHGFGVHAIRCGIPLNLVQKWLGHAQLSTTAIYANASGPEEYMIASRMWRN